MTDCIENLRKLIGEIESLSQSDWENPENEVWKGKVLRLIKRCFGEGSDYANEIEDVLNPTMIVTRDTPDSYWTKTHLHMLENANAHLNAYLDELEDLRKEEKANTEIQDEVLMEGTQNMEAALRRLEFIFKKFHGVAKSLMKRHDNRTTLRINDEYDVQDLLRSQMIIFFDDIRLEQYTPGYASKSVKMDFLLNKEQIVVECKMTRTNHSEKKISDELIIDIARYVKDSRCKRLVCLIYDPGEFIDNKSVLCDLEDKSTSTFSVHIYVLP
jgi:REase_DpnII-MboI